MQLFVKVLVVLAFTICTFLCFKGFAVLLLCKPSSVYADHAFALCFSPDLALHIA